MNDVTRTLQAAVADLRDCGASFAIVGGLAVGVRSEARMTRDVDIAVAVADDAGAESLIRALVQRGYRVRALLEHETTGRLVTARLDPPGENPAGVIVDLLLATTRIEGEIVRAAEPTTIAAGLVAPVATRAHLIAMKVLAMDDVRRPKDRVDLAALLGVAGPAERADARRALELIHARGAAGSKDLLALFDALTCRTTDVAD